MKRNTMLILILCVVMGLFVGCGKSEEEKAAELEAQNKATYEEAMELLEDGKYDDGKALLETIPEYKDVSTVLEQIKWESKAYTCLNDIRMGLKNRDSLYIKDIAFFSGDIKEGLGDDDLEMANKMSEIFCAKGEPVIVFFVSGENGFGGSSVGYYAFMYGEKGYEYLGFCSSLDPDKCSDEEETISEMINDCGKYLTVVGEIDLDRIHTIVKDQSYTAIKIIE
ncbi:hypothetical protein D3Z45_21420 [Lachnospiraceae bacterium]|nr:hypothetical protein [Lachnospiraceae bacterium]